MKKKLSFVTFFPPCEDIHLSKDVGMIPYILHRDFDYESYIVCYKGNYPSLETETRGLRLLFMKSQLTPFRKKILTEEKNKFAKLLRFLLTVVDGTFVILKYGKDIDLLQLYHLTPENIVLGSIYKLVNRKGILYLKLDMNPDIVRLYKKKPRQFMKSIKYVIGSLFLKKVSFDIISVETNLLYNFLIKKHPLFSKIRKNVYYIPNGIDVKKLSSMTKRFDHKENIILHVGRIGSFQKASEIILNAFAKISPEFPDWRLLLVGPIEEKFKEDLYKFLENNKYLKDRISYEGFVIKKKLYEIYSKAKILAMPSRYEGFSLAAIEGEFFGNVILGSDIPSLREATKDGELGYLCPIDDIECFTKTLIHILSHEEEIKKRSELLKDFIKRCYNWSEICKNLHKIIIENKKEKF